MRRRDAPPRGRPEFSGHGRRRGGQHFNVFRENIEHRKRMKELGKDFRPSRKWLIFIFAQLHVGLAICWLLSHLVLDTVYAKWFPQYEDTLLRQYFTFVLTMFFLFVAASLIRLFFAPLRRQMEWFMQMIHAMKQLSKGNFNVNLDANPRFMGQFGPLVTSFNEMASQLNHMEQIRQEFISNVSHEIQSPLTSIAGFARALQRDDLAPETRKHYQNIIETESKRLSRMSDNLLKLTSLESRQHPFETKTYRLDRQLRHLILSCEPQWQDKKIEMDVDLPECSLTADEDLLSQVWVNLLHNAIKFAPEGGTIGVRVSKVNDRIRVLITDDGPGISEAALPHIFERFYKEDKARTRAGGGSGLGLSIVKKIVELHGGETFAYNLSPSGAAFAVDLPFSRADSPP
ncbi:ATP-binding protein [Cohnella sp.]|uniref:HAMP domain-containing sensor histidine kinase n=1 Tax=Cohnella sp. TaxID=1883426 RepID=UPI003563B5F2